MAKLERVEGWRITSESINSFHTDEKAAREAYRMALIEELAWDITQVGSAAKNSKALICAILSSSKHQDTMLELLKEYNNG